MMTVAVGVGGNFGRGAMVCRSGKQFDGAWGSPAMYTLQGGSIGLQIGAESTDLVLLVMNPVEWNALLGSKVKLVERLGRGRAQGRSVDASTDASMRSENSQLFQVARPCRRRVALGRLASAGQRRQSRVYGSSTRRGASSRGRPGGARVRAPLRQCAAEELSRQRVGWLQRADDRGRLRFGSRVLASPVLGEEAPAHWRGRRQRFAAQHVGRDDPGRSESRACLSTRRCSSVPQSEPGRECVSRSVSMTGEAECRPDVTAA